MEGRTQRQSAEEELDLAAKKIGRVSAGHFSWIFSWEDLRY